MQEFKILKSEVNNQMQSLEMLHSSAKKLRASNPKLSEKIDVKLKTLTDKFDKISEWISKWGTFLEEVSEL